MSKEESAKVSRKPVGPQAWKATPARKKLAAEVMRRLQESNPDPKTELDYTSPYELVVAVSLSAQCTDVRVNKVTPALFQRFPDAQSLAAAEVDEIFSYIRSISYPNNKAKNLHLLGQTLMTQFGGEVPATVADLETLPGVGRKTANVVASVLYGAAAMPVDTHVFRVANRLGLTVANNPAQSERQLVALLPGDILPRAHHWLILHGRYVCKARSPLCADCVLHDICPSRMP